MADPGETTRVSETLSEAETSELLAAVRGLAAQVGSLRAELHALRSSVAPLPEEAGAHGWDDAGPAARTESPRWVRTLDSPQVRRPAVPRLLLEIVFLVAVAVLVAVAGFEPPLVVAVMAGAWGLVAAAEWLASREAAKRELALYASPFGAGVLAEDPSWFGPPPGHDLAAVVPDRDATRGEETMAKLPPAADE